MKVHPRITNIQDNEWGVDITKYAQNILGDILSRAVIVYYADSKSEAMSTATSYIKDFEKSCDLDYYFDSDMILLEFINGKKMFISSDENGKICNPYFEVPEFDI